MPAGEVPAREVRLGHFRRLQQRNKVSISSAGHHLLDTSPHDYHRCYLAVDTIPFCCPVKLTVYPVVLKHSIVSKTVVYDTGAYSITLRITSLTVITFFNLDFLENDGALQMAPKVVS